VSGSLRPTSLMLSHRRARRIASTMLLAWLLATFASWANACLVQSSIATLHAPFHLERFGSAADYDAAHGEAAVAAPASEFDPALQACLSFCETEQSLVAKAQQAKGDDGANVPLLPPSGLGVWLAFTRVWSEPRWRPLAEPPPSGPPVAIAFLRLTL
jgi:hypothetical protein